MRVKKGSKFLSNYSQGTVIRLPYFNFEFHLLFSQKNYKFKKKKPFSPLSKIKKKIHPLAHEGQKGFKFFFNLPSRYLHVSTRFQLQISFTLRPKKLCIC